MIIKNKARVNAFYFIYLPPRFLSRKTHGVSLYAKLAINFEMTIEYAEEHIRYNYNIRSPLRQLKRLYEKRHRGRFLLLSVALDLV